MDTAPSEGPAGLYAHDERRLPLLLPGPRSSGPRGAADQGPARLILRQGAVGDRPQGIHLHQVAIDRVMRREVTSAQRIVDRDVAALFRVGVLPSLRVDERRIGG